MIALGQDQIESQFSTIFPDNCFVQVEQQLAELFRDNHTNVMPGSDRS